MATKIEDYPSGSKSGKTQEDPKDVKPIVQGKVKKKSLISNEDFQEKKNRILFDVILPTVRDNIIEIVRIVLGASSRNNNQNGYGGYKNSYQNYYNQPNNYSSPYQPINNARPDGFMTYNTREDALAVLADIQHQLQNYGSVSMYYYRKRSGDNVVDWALNSWGWTLEGQGDSGRTLMGIRELDIRREYGRWIIPMPKPEQIN